MTKLTLIQTLKIGKYDQKKNANGIDQFALMETRRAFLDRYHFFMTDNLKQVAKFREDDRLRWLNFSPVPEPTGTLTNNANEQLVGVRFLQQFLKDKGFFPKSSLNGIFSYETQAAVRLFQEYVRTVEGIAEIGAPDGVVGKGTLAHIERWHNDPNLFCKWCKTDKDGKQKTNSPEYDLWMGLLKKAKEKYSGMTDHPILKHVNANQWPSYTRKPADWIFEEEDLHLIGIRFNEDLATPNRANDDLFILLVNGIVFKFWGSTDPSQKMAHERKEEAFLAEGQHKFRFGWHKRGDVNTAYRALKPYFDPEFPHIQGVMVFRDWDNDDALKPADIAKGLDPIPNTTINIHWSGFGTSNFSAGCQVIAGNCYLNQDKKLIDCSGFAARTANKDFPAVLLGASSIIRVNGQNINVRLTKAAYNVFTDLVLCYAKPGADYLYYTLAHDESLVNMGAPGLLDELNIVLKNMKRIQ